MPIIEAVASMVAHGRSGEAGDLAEQIAQAMSKAVAKAQAAGVADPEALRKVQLDARDEILNRGNPT
ncbi:MAG: hypothetical protein JWP25_8963 [Bradyrhizobium sp.]|nr:hypothetical protein [Bradyrhizobium sp.]